jgi:hypothetical protein
MRCGILLLQEKFRQKWNMGTVFTGEGIITFTEIPVNAACALLSCDLFHCDVNVKR